MSSAIGTYYPCAVNRKSDVETLYCYIVNKLIITALQKCRVNGHHGF